MNYPTDWPKPNPKHSGSLINRITEQEKADLYARVIHAKDIAATYNVSKSYVQALFPGREPVFDKKPLLEARREYRLSIARQVIAKVFTLKQGAELANTSIRTMTRNIARAKECLT